MLCDVAISLNAFSPVLFAMLFWWALAAAAYSAFCGGGVICAGGGGAGCGWWLLTTDTGDDMALAGGSCFVGVMGTLLLLADVDEDAELDVDEDD